MTRSRTMITAAVVLLAATAGCMTPGAPQAERSGMDHYARILHMAAHNGDAHDAEFAIRTGADPNARDRTGRTPLHRAAARNALDVAELLLEFGAEPDARDRSGRTPLDHAGRAGAHFMVLLLLRHGARVMDPDALSALKSAPIREEDLELAEAVRSAILERLERDGANQPSRPR